MSTRSRWPASSDAGQRVMGFANGFPLTDGRAAWSGHPDDAG